MRLALAANPNAGGDASPEEVTERLRRLGAEVVSPEEEADRVVVAGGDGSVGLAAAVAQERGLPLAVIPAGTANDFARALDVPLDLGEACELAAAEDAELKPVDLAWMTPSGGRDPRPFVNVAAAGPSPAAAQHAATLKKALGAVAYPVGALWSGLFDSPVECRVTCGDREVFAGTAWQVAVAGTGAFGGGASVGFAEDGDRCLDVGVAPAGSRLALPRLALALRRGRLAEVPGVCHARRTRVEVEVPEGTLFNVDGEVVESGPATFAADSRRVQVVAGRG